MFYRQGMTIYPNKNRTKISRISTFFSPLGFYSDSPQNMGRHIEYFASCKVGKGVGIKRYIQVIYVPANVVLA